MQKKLFRSLSTVLTPCLMAFGMLLISNIPLQAAERPRVTCARLKPLSAHAHRAERRYRRCLQTARAANLKLRNSGSVVSLPETFSVAENEQITLKPEIYGNASNYRLTWTAYYRGQAFKYVMPELPALISDDTEIGIDLEVFDLTKGKVIEGHNTTLKVLNTAPALKVKAPAEVLVGETFTIHAMATDNSPIDQQSGFTYQYSLSRGPEDQQLNSSGYIRQYYYKPGIYKLSVMVTDKDGDSTIHTQTITVLTEDGEYPEVTSTPQPTQAPIPQVTPRPAPVAANPTPTPEPPKANDPAPPSNNPPAVPPVAAPTPPAGSIPAAKYMTQWESQMLQYGKQNCNTIGNTANTQDNRLGSTYYDATWVFFQIADYTGDNYWLSCAQKAKAVYRDLYVVPASGHVPGYWNFSHGLLEDYLRNRDAKSRQALLLLSEGAAYAGDQTPLEWTVSSEYSREVAYAIMTYINAEKAGAPRRARLAKLVDQALAHMSEWFVTKRAPYVRPFMVALTAQALIMYDQQVGDARIKPAIELAANRIWNELWLADRATFVYTDRNHSTGGMEPAWDLNLLIAPMYGWLYSKTGNSSFIEKGDKIFQGGVSNAWLVQGKQYNQNYRWSFQYLKWRNSR